MILDEVLTVQEVAQLFKVSRVTVWRWCQQGILPAFKVGRGWRMRREDVEKLMEQNLGQQNAAIQAKGETTAEKTFPILV